MADWRHQEPIAVESGGEALALVLDQGCPLCGYVAESERRYFTWFRVEGHRAEEVVAQLRASRGFCPAHTRALLSEKETAELVAGVARAVVESAVRDLDELRQIARCPACTSLEGNRDYCGDTIASSLTQEQVADAYTAAGGYCLSHLLERLQSDPPTAAHSEIDIALDALNGGSAQIAAGDTDAARRHRLRAILPDSDGPGPSACSSLGRLARRVEEPVCPICLALAQAEHQYLSWLAASVQDQQVPYLCSAHLHDLRHLSASAGDLVAAEVGRTWVPALEQAREILESSKVRRRALRQARDLLSGTRPCSACRSIDAVERRQLELMEAACLDARFVRVYERSHGLCLRHVLMTQRTGSSKLLGDVARARLAVLGWELEEGHRKRAWDYRHEPPGPEQSAGVRALAAIDGRVFLGAPPLSAMDSNVFA
jgi:hypothetical protein